MLVCSRFEELTQRIATMPNRLTLIITLAIVLITASACEINQDGKNQEKKNTQPVKKVTIADVERGIRANIDAKTAEAGGQFLFSNDTTDFRLKLVRVHTEYLSVLGPHKFFACVDLATEDGDVYDLDFFLDGDPGNMHVTRTSLHKLNGKPYYTWRQKKDKTWYTVPIENASNKLLGIIEGTDTFTFHYDVVLPEITDNGAIWLPVAQSDAYQEVALLSLDAPAEYQMLHDKEYNNAIFYMKVLPEHSGKSINIVYKVKRLEKSPYEKAADENLTQYLQASALIPVDGRFPVLAKEIISKKQATTPIMQARALYDYVIDNVRYAKQGVYGTGDANYACDSKSGNCTEFHSLFISLARSAGIPARFAVGAAIPSSRDEGGVDGYHCWAEFYAEGKWWPVDISEADKYTALATYYFGHHPANRIEFSRGRDLAPDPLPKSGRINFLAYPVLEVNGVPDLANVTFTFYRSQKDI